jgi:hypothetical protein
MICSISTFFKKSSVKNKLNTFLEENSYIDPVASNSYKIS